MLGLFLLAVGSPLVQAAVVQVVNIDFQSGSNTYTGVGELGSGSDTIWNPVGPSGSGGTNLLYADGSGPSGVSIHTTHTNGHSNNIQANPLLNDWLYTYNTQETITISGLASNSIVDIAFYDGFYWQDFTVPSQTGLIAQVEPTGPVTAPPFRRRLTERLVASCRTGAE